jgi:hypothetical protein
MNPPAGVTSSGPEQVSPHKSAYEKRPATALHGKTISSLLSSETAP